MSVPKPSLDRICEVHKLPKTIFSAQHAKNNETHHQPSIAAHGRALDLFLRELHNTAPEHRQPFIINLNGDSSLLICIPLPAHFNDLPDFILSLEHLEPGAYRSIAAVELLIRAIEDATTDMKRLAERQGDTSAGIDAIIIFNGVSDHAHRETLQNADPETPVLAAPDALLSIQAWDHFKQVWPLPNMHILDDSPLPRWLNVMRLSESEGLLEIAHGILISWTRKPAERPEAILYAPHGVAPGTVEPVLAASPTLQLLALLHPVNETLSEGAPLTLGVDNGLEVYRLIEARYWLQVHDADFKRTGLLAPFQQFRERSLAEALETNPGPRPNLRARANGDILVLE